MRTRPPRSRPPRIVSGGQPVAQRDVGAQRAQRVDQHLDRPLGHRVVADQRHLAVDERGDRREEAHRRAAVADEQRSVGRVQPRASAAHDERVAAGVRDVDAHARQRRAHVTRVVALERAGQPRLAVGERRQHQGAVGDALRSGDGPGHVDGAGQARDDERRDGTHARSLSHGVRPSRRTPRRRRRARRPRRSRRGRSTGTRSRGPARRAACAGSRRSTVRDRAG